MQRLLLAAVALGLTAVVAAVDAASQRAVASKVRNGKISFWSDRAFGGRAQVFVVRADGKRLRRLTRHPGEDYAADFSPDGRKILFLSDRTGLRQVYVMNLDGSSQRKHQPLEEQRLG